MAFPLPALLGLNGTMPLSDSLQDFNGSRFIIAYSNLLALLARPCRVLPGCRIIPVSSMPPSPALGKQYSTCHAPCTVWISVKLRTSSFPFHCFRGSIRSTYAYGMLPWSTSHLTTTNIFHRTSAYQAKRYFSCNIFHVITTPCY